MTGQPHNFGECRECGCLTTRLMEVTNLVTGAKDWRVCCILSPGHHWRPATDADRALDATASDRRIVGFSVPAPREE